MGAHYFSVLPHQSTLPIDSDTGTAPARIQGRRDTVHGADAGPAAGRHADAASGPGGSGAAGPFGGRTAQEALALARRFYPPAIPQDVRLARGGYLSILLWLQR